MSEATATRAAAPSEARAVAHALVRAFADDPVQRFLFPSDREYETRGVPNFELLVRRAFAIGVVDVTGGVEGAALWLPPGVDFLDRPGGVAFAVRSVWKVRAHVGRARALLRELARFHPHDRHWYLPVLGTDPAHQGKGMGSALLARALARSDAAGLPAYLESSKAANLPFYQRHGFEVVGKIAIPGGPELWPMLRKPRPQPARND
jgi:ribosomal protein S18 acetylase RimI-like enzyme